MKLVTPEEKLELEKFLEPHLLAIWEHKNSERPDGDKVELLQTGFDKRDIVPFPIREGYTMTKD